MKLYEPLRKIRIRWMEAVAAESAYVQQTLLHSSIHFHEDQRGEPIGGTSLSHIDADIAFSDRAMLLYHKDILHNLFTTEKEDGTKEVNQAGPSPEEVHLVLTSVDRTITFRFDQGKSRGSQILAFMPLILIAGTILSALAGAVAGSVAPIQ